MSKIYRLKEGLLGQEVNASERPIWRLHWLSRGTRFFIHHEKHIWYNGCFAQYYCTVLVQGSCRCYNVKSTALEAVMEEIEFEREAAPQLNY